jgi:hypothetical protein
MQLASSVLEQTRQQQPQPDRLEIRRRVDGQLWATWDGRSARVIVRRCFPWSEPGQFVSLRTADRQEFALIREVADLDFVSRSYLEEALAQAGFVLAIERILDIDEEVEIRTWQVVTKQGARRFQTRLDDWPREVPGGGLLIRDVAGDLYHIADAHALDKKSQQLLWAFVD